MLSSPSSQVALQGVGVGSPVSQAPAVVRAGEGAPITITIPGDMTPTAGTLFFRESGKRAFQEQAFDPGESGSE